ncbi:MAG: hypothetical protein ACTSYJ_08165 [Candidatus Thorarchaeota archaeon]
MYKFILRDRTGHSVILVPPEEVNEKIAEFEDQGYLVGQSTKQTFEVIPVAVGG